MNTRAIPARANAAAQTSAGGELALLVEYGDRLQAVYLRYASGLIAPRTR